MRGDGDGWVRCARGHQHWGRYGAAGLLLRRPDPHLRRSVLLQHRALWSHHGGTWGLPGGARDSQETVEEAALREAAEEAGLAAAALDVRHVHVDDHGGWSYTTVVADSTYPPPVTAAAAETVELRWVVEAEVGRLRLHPGFAATWPALRLLA